MNYVLTSGSEVVQYPYTITQLRVDNPDTSFPISPTLEQLAEFGVYPVVPSAPPSYDRITENLNEIDPVLEDSIWVQQWSVTPATSEEIAERELQAQQANKAQAQSLLSATDWTDIPAVSDPANNPHLVNRDEFNAYRLQLRGIAVNPPVTVDPWPVQPEEIWAS